MEHESRTSQGDLLDWYRRAPLRMARSRRELFSLLAYHDARESWSDFVGRIDFTGVIPGQISEIVLDRSPESIDFAVGQDGYDPAVHFCEAMLSTEFRRKIQSAFLRAYPEKARDVFIHVPKCAGTDLILNLGHRSVPLPKNLEIEGWLSNGAFLETVAGLARAASSNDRLFAYGHMELGGYAGSAGIRAQDNVFTVLRDPVDQLISQANYAIGRLRQDPTGNDPDTAGYLAQLGLPRLPENATPSDLKNLAVQALLNPRIVQPNRACFYLGRGNQCRYAVAMENLVIHNVEITTTQNYNRWILERWGISKSRRHNSSESILMKAEARHLCPDVLAAATAEDQKLFDAVSWGLRKTGGASITGLNLARLIGPSLTKALACNAIPDLPPPQADEVQVANMLVASNRKSVDLYLTPPSTTVPGTMKLDTVLKASFSADGDAKQYRLGGWAFPEKNFTWTAAKECQIRLPPVTADGKVLFRIITAAFVNKDRLLSQHVELLVGGHVLGRCDVSDLSVLECELPAHLLGNGEPIVITLRLPDAAQPRAVSGANDDRLLALAVHSIAVLRLCREVTLPTAA